MVAADSERWMALVRAALCREDEHVGLSICVAGGHANVHVQGAPFDRGT